MATMASRWPRKQWYVAVLPDRQFARLVGRRPAHAGSATTVGARVHPQPGDDGAAGGSQLPAQRVRRHRAGHGAAALGI